MSEIVLSGGPSATEKRQALKEIVAKLAAKDQELTEDANKGDRLDSYAYGMGLLESIRTMSTEDAEVEMRKHGFTSLVEMRRAVHALAPQKEAPLYMVAALKRQEVRVKNGVGSSIGTMVNVIMQPPPSLERDEDVIDVGGDR